MSEKRELSKRESQCLIELYKLITKYQLSIRHTTADDGIHLTVDGLTEGNELSPEPAFIGFLSDMSDLVDLQKTIEPYLTQPELYNLKIHRVMTNTDTKARSLNSDPMSVSPEYMDLWNTEFLKNLESEGLMLIEENKFEIAPAERDTYPFGLPYRAPSARQAEGALNTNAWHPFSLVVWKQK